MSKASLRRRIRDAGQVRRLTNGEADSLLAATKTVGKPIEWTSKDRLFVRMEVPVKNPAGENLKMTCVIRRDFPGRSSWTLTWGRKQDGEFPESIRRLDLRGKHFNPDGERWEDRTHKHRWSEADNNDWAYTPEDIPHEIPGAIVGRDNYREIFEAFAAECGVAVGGGYQWLDPDLDSTVTQEGLWEM